MTNLYGILPSAEIFITPSPSAPEGISFFNKTIWGGGVGRCICFSKVRRVVFFIHQKAKIAFNIVGGGCEFRAIKTDQTKIVLHKT